METAFGKRVRLIRTKRIGLEPWPHLFLREHFLSRSIDSTRPILIHFLLFEAGGGGFRDLQCWGFSSFSAVAVPEYSLGRKVRLLEDIIYGSFSFKSFISPFY